MDIWLICLPIALGLFAAIAYAIHRLSPLRSRTTASSVGRRTGIVLYSIIIISILTASLPFTDFFSGFSASGFVLGMTVSSIIAAVATECGYFLSKKNGWNKGLFYTSVLIGTFFAELALVVGYVASLPPGSVT